MAEHTPLPWSYDTYNTVWSGSGEDAKEIFAIPDHPTRGEFLPEQIAERSAWYKESAANVDFILRAVYSYYPLLEALKKYVEHFGDPAEGRLIGARALIAKAEAEGRNG